MNSIGILIYLLTILSISGIVLLIVFATKARNRSNFIERYGCTPKDFEKIKKYKELFDAGVITQQEFELEKNKILNFK
jgi:hypothetical protein